MLAPRQRFSLLITVVLLAGLNLQGCAKSGPAGPESIGEISAMFGGTGVQDVREYQWHIVGIHGNGHWSTRSTWQEKSSVGSVTLFGQRALDMEDTLGSVMIRFDVDKASGEATNVKMRYFIDGLEKNSFASKGKGNASVRIEKSRLDGRRMHLRGTFEATLPFRLRGKSRDNVRTMTDGKFDVLIPITGAT